MKTLTAVASVLLAAAAGVGTPAGAQPVSIEHVRGQIIAADSSSMTVKTRAGVAVRLTFAPDLSVTSVMKAEFGEVKVGTYVGSAAVPIRPAPRTFDMKTPTLTALEIQIFPEVMKGTDEGQRRWDLTADSTMTNGTVYDLEGRVLSVRFKGNERDVYVPPSAPVVRIGSGDRGLLKPGAHIFAVVAKGADGSLTALRISIGTGGLIPPM